jgi:NADH-quinone oxidoreductase subunit E
VTIQLISQGERMKMFSCCQEKNPLESKFLDTEIDLRPLETVLQIYGNQPGNLITILQKTQDIYGYLPRRALKYISRTTGIKPALVLGTATFYTQFRFKPVGKYLIMLCQGTACHVNGSEKIENVLWEELNIRDGDTTKDNLFTLENVACLGCCSLAPVMMINGEVYGNLTPALVRKIIREIYHKETDINVGRCVV